MFGINLPAGVYILHFNPPPLGRNKKLENGEKKRKKEKNVEKKEKKKKKGEKRIEEGEN